MISEAHQWRNQYIALEAAADILADASEALASSEPTMPSHESTVEAFDAALDAYRNLRASMEPRE